MSTTCDIYTTFGGGSPAATNVDCELYPDMVCGLTCNEGLLVNKPPWTHYIDVASSVTILDALTRTAGAQSFIYADGYEVRIPSGVANRYVVVWVEPSPSGGKRAYLMRHSVADWTNL